MFQNEKLDDSLNLNGEVLIEVFDKSGAVKESRKIKNLVVTAGKAHIAARMAGTSSGVMSHMGIGSGTTAAAAGDVALGTELGRVALASINASGAVVTHSATFPAGTGTGAVSEAGLFNASSAGTMQCRTVFPVVNKGADDAMAITWTVTVS